MIVILVAISAARASLSNIKLRQVSVLMKASPLSRSEVDRSSVAPATSDSAVILGRLLMGRELRDHFWD